MIAIAIRENRELPQKIANAPEPWLGSQLWLDAFFDLSSERQVGMALGPIPWSSIQRWGQCYGVEGEQLEDLHWYVSRLDVAYLKHSQSAGANNG